MLNIISLGAGVQSTVMALIAEHGEIEKPDCAIFADTASEPDGVYEHLDWLEKQLSYPVHTVGEGNLWQDTLGGVNSTGNKFISIPAYTTQGERVKEGRLRRQCTREYKIKPIARKARNLLGYEKGQRIPPGSVKMWIGISTDEAVRMKPSQERWIENCWPLIDLRMSRHDCMIWFERNYPGRKLTKSACVFCPYHNDAEWRRMKEDDPKSWRDAVTFDKAIREDKRGKVKENLFLHRSLKPLDEVDLSTAEDHGQLNFFNNECEGMCGV